MAYLIEAGHLARSRDRRCRTALNGAEPLLTKSTWAANPPSASVTEAADDAAVAEVEADTAAGAAAAAGQAEDVDAVAVLFTESGGIVGSKIDQPSV